MKKLETTVISVIAEIMSVNEREISMETDLIEDLGADELDLVDIISTLEEEFGIDINEEIAEQLFNVGGIVTYLKNQGC